jgi:hypothetical protein
MKTVFKVGMKVYDNVFFPNSKGEVVRIDKHYDCERVIVRFDNWDYDASYTEKGRLVSTYRGATPTLSTSPYTLQGFEQKAPAPTFEEAWTETERIYEPKSEYDKEEFGGYPSQELANAAEALRRLLFLRDYYNEGWQPDWKDNSDKCCITLRKGKFTPRIYYFDFEVLHFKSIKIRDKFLEEQRELLEIAKPLL